MAGLMNSQGSSGSQPPADIPPREDVSDDETNVTPEEQEAYDQFVKNGFELIYTDDGKVRPNVLTLLDNDPNDLKGTLPPEAFARIAEVFDPANALASATVSIVLNLVKSAAEAGALPDPAVIYHGGEAIMEDLAEVSQKAGIHDHTEQEMQKAWMTATQLYYQAASELGLIDQADAEQDMQAIRQADESGELQKMMQSPAGEVPPEELDAGADPAAQAQGPGGEVI